MKKLRTRFFCLALVVLAALGPGCATTTQHHAPRDGFLLERETVKTPMEDVTGYLTWFVLEFAYGLGQCGTTFEIK